MKHVATIYFESDEDTNVDLAARLAADCMENFDATIKVHDTHVEPYEDEQPDTNGESLGEPLTDAERNI